MWNNRGIGLFSNSQEYMRAYVAHNQIETKIQTAEEIPGEHISWQCHLCDLVPSQYHLDWPLDTIFLLENKLIFRNSTWMQFPPFFPSCQTAPFGRVHLFFRADKSSGIMCWKGCFVHRLPPSSQIDGACNWQPLCAIAKINRHWCRHGKSVSCTKQAADGVELMGRHIYRQNTINISANRFCSPGGC